MTQHKTVTVRGRDIEHPETLRRRVRDLRLLVEHTPVRNIDWEESLTRAQKELAFSEYVYGDDE